MANIMNQVKLHNNVKRNGFDLSRKNIFTAKIGELLPVACIECIPGDKFNLSKQHFTRTSPVNTAAYTRIREYYDWFFVPTNLLWNKFNTFITNMRTNTQHATSIVGSLDLVDRHPYFTVNQLSDYVSTLMHSQDNYNIFNYSRALNTCKLLHYLDYGDYFKAANTGNVDVYRYNANLNPFPLLAYQKIYQDYYRNSQWESSYSPAFNLDYISGSQASLNIPVSQLLTQSRTTENMFDLRYCNWNKDMFFGVLPNQQFGDSASVIVPAELAFNSDTYSTVNFNLTRSDKSNMSIDLPLNTNGSHEIGDRYITEVRAGTLNTSSLYQFIDTSQLRQAVGLSPNSITGSEFTILALRQSEALQKWREITQSQQQDYKAQIEAHFGVNVNNAYSERCSFVDGFVNNLDISEVTNTNITGDNMADIAGKGVGVGEGKTNFTADVHGYLMCVYHAMPILEYASDGIDRRNLKTLVTDYAIPEFDATGMSPLNTVELTNEYGNPTFTPSILGYVPRYIDYKTAVDKVHGAFYNGGAQYENWVAPIDSGYIQKYIAAMHGDGSSISYQWFKVNPAVMNPIFAVQVTNSYVNNPTGVGDDQLLVNCSFDIKAVRNLDRNGLPY